MQKSIFITGAASGIGKATAELFAKMGWYVGLFDINQKDLSALYSRIGEENACMKQVDVTDPESIKSAVIVFAENTGNRMDVLFNCAGILSMGHYDKISLHDQKKMVDVNLTGILNCIYACFDILKLTDNSRIINMSSASAIYGTPELAVYSATKFAVRGLTEALNIEFEKYGVWVCDIMVPYVNTPMITNAGKKASSVDRFGIHITPEQVAECIFKAASNQKVHWVLNVMLKLLIVFNKLGPAFINRLAIKLMMFSNK